MSPSTSNVLVPNTVETKFRKNLSTSLSKIPEYLKGIWEACFFCSYAELQGRVAMNCNPWTRKDKRREIGDKISTSLMVWKGTVSCMCIWLTPRRGTSAHWPSNEPGFSGWMATLLQRNCFNSICDIDLWLPFCPSKVDKQERWLPPGLCC